MKFYGLLAALGAFIATISTVGCVLFLLDEPDMPKSLL